MDLHQLLKDLPKGRDGTTIDPQCISTLQHLIQESYGNDATPRVLERFQSKKNVVLHLSIPDSDQEFVTKIFVTEAFGKEVKILQDSFKHGLSVPEVINARDDVLLMSYIPGPTLVDVINQSFSSGLMKDLAEWYFYFHSVHGEIKGDPRLRNFIYNTHGIFGVDFEETRQDHWILDIAGIAASIFDTNPIFDKRKHPLAWNLLEAYLDLRHSKRDPAIDHLFIKTIAGTLRETAELRNDSRIYGVADAIENDAF